ncbi:hypothetical protein [Streptomyces sp. NPDC049585]|uniref:hypothetical protein n=1 Tax=Streptomyces sp. NPDC049585 TaxID=3155154 RepID=UPI00344A083A
MKRTTLRAAGVSVLTAVALGAAAAPAALAAGTTGTTGTPSVEVRKIFTGNGIVASLDVSFDYVCNADTERLDVTLLSAPAGRKPVYLTATKAKGDLQCDGRKHTGLAEWHDMVDANVPARATLELYGKGSVLQTPLVEKTMKPGPGRLPFGD